MKPLLNLTIAQFMERTATRWPGRTALTFKGMRWTYRELDVLTDRIAAGLMAAGVRRGNHVAILSENIPNAVFCFLAIEKAGCVSCMLNTGLKAGELAELMALSNVRFLMIGNSYKGVDFYEESRRIGELYPLEAVFDISGVDGRPCLSLERLIQMGVEQLQGFRQARDETHPQDDGLILYTSGTTGSSPKAVVSSYYNLVNGGIQKAHSQSLTEQDVICCALQLFHIFCIDVNVLSALACGACLAMPDDLHTKSILKTIQAERCTVLSCVPCMYQAMMGRGDFYSFDLSCLRTGIIGGAYCPPETFVRIEQAFGLTLLPGLGQTEATAGIAIAAPTDSLEIRSTTVGRFVDHSNGKIADLESGTALKTGETGEICVKSRLLMTGYYNRPDLTAQAIDRDGWLHTGDLGFLDSGGYLHYVGRIKEIINRGGEKIWCTDIEDEIQRIPGVKEVAVAGIPDAIYGEVAAAVVVAHPGTRLSREQIQDELKDRVARYKIPQKILFVDEIPKTPGLKVDKKHIRTMFGG